MKLNAVVFFEVIFLVFFRQVRGNLGKTFRSPKRLLAPTPMKAIALFDLSYGEGMDVLSGVLTPQCLFYGGKVVYSRGLPAMLCFHKSARIPTVRTHN